MNQNAWYTSNLKQLQLLMCFEVQEFIPDTVVVFDLQMKSYAVNWVVFLLNVGLSWKSKKCCIFLSIIPLILILRISWLQYRFAILLLLGTVDANCLTRMAAYTNHLFISVLFEQQDLFLALEWIAKLFFLCPCCDKMATKSLGNGLEIRT